MHGSSIHKWPFHLLHDSYANRGTGSAGIIRHFVCRMSHHGERERERERVSIMVERHLRGLTLQISCRYVLHRRRVLYVENILAVCLRAKGEGCVARGVLLLLLFFYLLRNVRFYRPPPKLWQRIPPNMLPGGSDGTGPCAASSPGTRPRAVSRHTTLSHSAATLSRLHNPVPCAPSSAGTL